MAARLLVEEVLCALMPKHEEAVRPLLSLRAFLLAKASAALSNLGNAAAEVQKQARSDVYVMSSSLLAVTNPFQEEPMTEEQLRVVTACTALTSRSEEFEKVIGTLLEDGWWKAAFQPCMKRTMNEVQPLL